MQWQPSYALGIDEIDQQHQKLLTHAAEIIGAIQQEKSWSDIYYLIEALRKFASFHFQFEEALMRMFGYPEHDGHARSHESFFSRLAALERQAIHDQLENNVVQMLTDWVMNHILCSDRDYVEYLKQIPGISLGTGRA